MNDSYFCQSQSPLFTQTSQIYTLFNIVKFRLDYQIGVQFCKSNQTLNIGSARNLIFTVFSSLISKVNNVQLKYIKMCII